MYIFSLVFHIIIFQISRKLSHAKALLNIFFEY